MLMRSKQQRSRRQFLQTSAVLAVAGTFGSGRIAFGAEPDLIVRTPEPFNAEPRLLALVADRITPVKHFYVRNHGPTPKVDGSSYKLRIEGLVESPMELSLAEIKEKFRQYSVEATLTCAGNRRRELSAIKPVGGVQWDAGAIGHARWTGASLAEVLLAAGMKKEVKHIWFEGLDPIKEKDGSVAPFGGSIPIEKTRAVITIDKGGQRIDTSGSSPVLIAHSMNDEPLTAEHGFPLRTIVPGYIGARSVKWLTKITLSDRPSPNHYVAEAYKVVQSDDKGEVAAADPIYAFPINAAICAPSASATIKAGQTLVSGYALPSGAGLMTRNGGGPITIAKVEVSGDGGSNWITARLLGQPVPFAWQQWSAAIDLAPGKHELVVRATDSRGNTMPERAEWNFKGYLYNGWHRVQVEAA
jgi:sulfite oxidase